MFVQRSDGSVQFLKKCVISHFLRIIWSGNVTIRAYLGIWNRTESIADTMHSRHFYYLCNGKRYRIFGIL